jgi:proteasome lid subunit RPN8/RPN11
VTSILRLTTDQYTALCAHAASDPSHEICGLIGGRWKPYDRLAWAELCIAVPNISPNPVETFLMAPQAQVRVMLDFEKAGLQTIGIYHSHPAGPAEPSPTDIRECAYPDAIYLICCPLDAVRGADWLDVVPAVQGYVARAWRIRRGLARPTQLLVADST